MNRWTVSWMSSTELFFSNCRIFNSYAHKRMRKNNSDPIFLAEAAAKTMKKKVFALKAECIWTWSFWEHRRHEIQHNFWVTFLTALPTNFENKCLYWNNNQLHCQKQTMDRCIYPIDLHQLIIKLIETFFSSHVMILSIIYSVVWAVTQCSSWPIQSGICNNEIKV